MGGPLLSERCNSSNKLLKLCTARTALYDSAIRSDSVFKVVSVFFGKCTTSWLRNAYQWKPDYRVVTNEKQRNYELFGADQ